MIFWNSNFLACCALFSLKIRQKFEFLPKIECCRPKNSCLYMMLKVIFKLGMGRGESIFNYLSHVALIFCFFLHRILLDFLWRGDGKCFNDNFKGMGNNVKVGCGYVLTFTKVYQIHLLLIWFKRHKLFFLVSVTFCDGGTEF